VTVLETIGFTEKSDLKVGKKCDPLLKEMFICRIPHQNRNPITQVMESRSAVLGSHSENRWYYGKIGNENELKIV